MWSLAEDWSVFIKLVDKGSFLVVWDREDYLAEGCKEPIDISPYVEVKKYHYKLLSEVREKGDKSSNYYAITNWQVKKELKYFSYNFKITSCLDKM